MTIKIWVDDIRIPPEGWVWLKSSGATIEFLESLKRIGTSFETISLDHDLGNESGYDDDTRKIVTWMIENEVFPTANAYIHTANPVGRDWLSGTIRRYFPDTVRVTG